MYALAYVLNIGTKTSASEREHPASDINLWTKNILLRLALFLQLCALTDLSPSAKPYVSYLANELNNLSTI